MKILVVDDEESICEEFRNILMDEGHDVDVCFGGRVALTRMRVAP